MIGPRLLPGAPAGAHSMGRSVQYRLDLVNLAALYLEQLRDLPRPGLCRPRGHDAPVGHPERARRAARMIEEPEREHDAALLVHRDVAPIADSGDEVQQPRLELLHAAP